MNDYTYKFGAVVGYQNGRRFYQATVPFRTLASMLKLDDDYDVNKRSQRLIDKPRAKKIANYLVKNIDGFFVIPPLVGFIDGEFSFTEVPIDGFEGVGRMAVNLESRFMLFDGQHRAFGIREAMALAPDMGSENVSIMFFDGLSLAERKQAFHDINFTQKKPAAALCIAYNERSDYDKMVIDALSSSDIRAHIEYEKNSVSGNNDNWYSLKTLKDYSHNLLGKELTKQSGELLQEFTNSLFKQVNIGAWLITGAFGKTAKDFREQGIFGHSVMLQAFGLLGHALLTEDLNNWKDKLQGLNNKSLWYKDAEHWKGRCINEKGKLVSNKLAIRLASYHLMKVCGLSLSPEQRIEESKEMNPINQDAA